MRKFLFLIALFGSAACTRHHEDLPSEETLLRKIEWQVRAAENYTEPWLDSVTASVQIKINKIDTVNRVVTSVWDTTFASRPVRSYPVLPQKHVVEKQVPVLLREKLQVWYNIRYEMNGSASETGRLEVVRKPFTFVDIKL